MRIFERSPTPLLHDQGAGIVAGLQTREFLKYHDKTGRPSTVASRTRLYLNKEGHVIHEESTLQHMTSWDLLYHICRANFDGLKSEYIGAEGLANIKDIRGRAAYEYGRRVTGIEPAGTELKVSFRSTIDGENKEETKHETADFVIVADGASSDLRVLLCPSSSPRTYAGYVAFRGTVPETDISSEAADVFIEKFPFFHAKGTQILAYVIPGPKGSLEHDKRKVNWVWYWNVDDSSDEYREILTDKHGAHHRWTLPPGSNMASGVWERQRSRARNLLPPQFAELVLKTESPFVQAITDLEPPADGKVWVLDGKAVIVGDCVAGFRPHTAASTSQAALHALNLFKVFAGDMAEARYQDEVLSFAREVQKHGVELGNRSQFGAHPFS